MVSLVNSHSNATSRRKHLLDVDLGFASGLPPGWPTPYTVHPAPYTLHRTLCTLHPTPNTLHPTPCTLHPTPHTPYHTPHTLHLSPCIPHPTPSTLNPQIRQRTDTGGVSCPAPHSGSKSPFSIFLMFTGCRQIPTTCSTNQGPWTDDLLLHTLNPQWSKQAAD